jgi:hypothetical protein
MIKLNPPENVLYDTNVLARVNRFHRAHKCVDAYVTQSWTLVFMVRDNPESFIAIDQEDWCPEFGDFYKIKESLDGSGEDEQKAQGGDP